MQNLTLDPYLPQLRQALELQKQAQWDAAQAIYRAVLAQAPEHALALHLLGVLLLQIGQVMEGVACLRTSVAHNPNDVQAWNNLAGGLQQAGDGEAALQANEQALARAPGHAPAWNKRAELLVERKELVQALEAYDKALSLAPQHLQALLGRANLLCGQLAAQQALPSAELALQLAPESYEANRCYGTVLWQLRRHAQSIQYLEKARQLRPQELSLLGALMWAYMNCCNWQGRGQLLAQIESSLEQGQWVAQPFVLVGSSASPRLLRRCGELQMQASGPEPTPMALPVRAQGRLRIAYLSADYHSHATVYLITELLELHDRSRFELFALSFGPDDNGPMRARITAAVDRFERVNDMSDAQIAMLVAELQVDIVVDLKGYTRDSRPGIFQYRPAPIVVNYLGYPGTMGAACYDYIIGDPVVTPLEHADFYSEKIVQLPHSYQVNDRQRVIAPHTPSRQQQGLPDEGFVFACFNNNYKITPEVFDVWMRLLAQVDGSVLWLLADNEDAVANLRREALARGIASSRLVFAPRAPLPEHLARHRLADLFLDTLPCNAHTTASDALWAGLPVLTCLGATFAGRVAASLLTAVGLPELVTPDLAAYEALALQLATDAGRLAMLRQKLLAQRDSAPLFDTPLFTAHLEKAYLQMVERYRQGLAPQAMVIT